MLPKYIELLPGNLQKVAQSEVKSLRYLKTWRFPRFIVVCPKCNYELPKIFRLHPEQKVRPVEDISRRINRYWCRNCHYRFTDFSNTFLASNKLSWSKMLGAINLFVLGKTARQSALMLKINYKSAHSLFRKIRLVISQKYSFSNKREMMYEGRRRRMCFKQGFQRYLKGRLGQHRHIASGNKLLYLLEQEFRYKERNSYPLETLLRHLLTPAPIP